MASSPVPNTAKARQPRPPITATPAFAWVVALWFAALLGVGLLIVPLRLIEAASSASGLSSILPQAAPPLGFTAQALLALAGTVGGGALGFVLARRLARGPSTRPATRSARLVLSASEDLAEADFDHHETGPRLSPHSEGTSGSPGARRRVLALAEDEGPSDFLHLVPLPGSEAHADDSARGPEPEMAEPEVAEFIPVEDDEAPFDLDPDSVLADDDAADGPVAPRQEFVAVAEAAMAVVAPEPEPEPEPQPLRNRATMAPLRFSPPSMLRAGVTWRDAPEASPEAGRAEEHEMAAEPEHADQQPLEAHRLFTTDSEPESEEDVSDKPIFDAAEPEAAAPDAPVDGEGLVQLVQRLAATLDKHREWAAEQALVRVAEPPAQMPSGADHEQAADHLVPEEFDPAAADDAAEAMAAWFGKPAAPVSGPVSDPVSDGTEAPSEVEPVLEAPLAFHYTPFAGATAIDEDEDVDDLAASFSLPLALKPVDPEPLPRPAFDRPAFDSPPAIPVPFAAEEVAFAEEDEQDETAEADHFASLNPFRQKAEQFVRIEEPEPEPGSHEPAVLFPGQDAQRAAAPARAFDPPAAAAAPARPHPSNDDNERALREALMNLQRMGK